METIYLKDINFDKLTKLTSIKTNTSKLYCDKNQSNFYKMYNDNIDRKEIFEILNCIEPIENVLMPHTVILNSKIKRSKVEGCISPYQPSAIPMFNFFEYFNDKQSFCEVISDCSKTLEKIHNNGIILGDVSFSNILFDLDKNHYYCDFDSIVIDENNCDIPGLIGWYYRYKDLNMIKVNNNFDRFSFFLHFVRMIFGKELNKINEERIEKESEAIPFLKDMKDLLFCIRERRLKIPQVPYLHEIMPEEPKIYQKK